MDELMERVLLRLGIASRPAPDLEGLQTVYGAWCARVPFDNIRKMIALRAGATEPLPGGDAADFFEHWLSHGSGGTCWPTSNALCELLRWLGFEARRITGSMRDLGFANHASVKDVGRVLCESMGISEALVEQWARCGCLTASFEEPSGERPPPITLRPPSQRGRCFQP